MHALNQRPGHTGPRTQENPTKIPDLLRVADETGHSFAELAGIQPAFERTPCPAPPALETALTQLLNLNHHLDDHALP